MNEFGKNRPVEKAVFFNTRPVNKIILDRGYSRHVIYRGLLHYRRGGDGVLNKNLTPPTTLLSPNYRGLCLG